ncbi:unnamed protein product [Danaus chrysippus]|uniref:(African queen) hypothetical protein n=1 Tax=Danaus chrysippus TaxID=151541 RepID=A0A8J2R947_9NEOP|nr:unnamed protein product [Danaus chrysippus]
MIKRDPELLINVADDDFDCLEETASDKDALGIKDEDDMHEELGESDETITNNEILPHTTAKRRPLEVTSIEEIPYDKKPKIKSELLSTR